MDELIYSEDLKEFKSVNNKKGKSELLKILHQLEANQLSMMQAIELLECDNIRLSALNEALLDSLYKNGIDTQKEIPNNLLNNYIAARKKLIDDTVGTISKEGMMLNAQFAGQDAITEQARIRGGFDKKRKPTKAQLDEYEIAWSKMHEYETGSNSKRGWKKDACAEFKITRNTLDGIIGLKKTHL